MTTAPQICKACPYSGVVDLVWRCPKCGEWYYAGDVAEDAVRNIGRKPDAMTIERLEQIRLMVLEHDTRHSFTTPEIEAIRELLAELDAARIEPLVADWLLDEGTAAGIAENPLGSRVDVLRLLAAYQGALSEIAASTKRALLRGFPRTLTEKERQKCIALGWETWREAEAERDLDDKGLSDAISNTVLAAAERILAERERRMLKSCFLHGDFIGEKCPTCLREAQPTAWREAWERKP